MISYTAIDDIPKIHQGLKAAFATGKSKPIAFRKKQLLRLLHLVDDNISRFREALLSDLGRPHAESNNMEIYPTMAEIKEAYDSVEKWAATEKAPFNANWFAMSPATRKEPKGVVLIISPYNFPMSLLIPPLAAAIAAGNAVMVKPSELSPANAALLAELLPKYLDPDLYHIVNGGVPEATKILELPFDHILYTGNGNVAKVVCAAAAKHLTPVTLELKGKNPCVIDPKCNLKGAAKRLMWGKLTNGGQICMAPDYVLVPEWFQDQFVSALEEAYREMHPEDPKTSGQMARMVNQRHAERVKRLIDNTKGTIVFGGEVDLVTKYAAPTVIKDVQRDDSLMSEEIFGPFLPIIPVKDVDEAIKFINARPQALNLYVFTNDPAFKAKVFDNTQSGCAIANETILHFSAHGLPFGGVGASGYGYTTGKCAFDTFTHLRATMDSPYWLDTVLLKARYPPYTENRMKTMKSIMKPTVPREDEGGLGKGVIYGCVLALVALASAMLVQSR
ncbi:aldehyde dehydrogenase [Laetiporus sulphureus 93-53]|uniref:Aldehyde dehydrogenase n=1 Tax=Laetiporus sulphureus 93-53 TaxID=1314785 RepID=A0A165D029_9APHY|nr:aldehyde dehydrogenase [Laetiporus sulphureus 93-53]KZT03863.1 aldehyde dehydrogenase [Laetiporus sulphureus 93-53]